MPSNLELSPSGSESPMGFLKINVGGAWRESHKVGGRVIIHDGDGCFVVAFSKSFKHVSSPIHIEALATHEELLLASHLGIQNLILESDSLQIAIALQSSSPDLPFIGHIGEDSKALLHEITGATDAHARRHANEVAHRLAQYALFLPI
ncbi:hypothetical protein D8674_024357 [Pyrus ussuriensis x Pyrus communis]|uniref:RNase H type-1 domain-containing protein n=1 Tax=Pyrus ussuriensis x Pyrus communis TaxID=2448454 RepID=A0A5N5H2P6_9ROSA|nr:hypothetical protein D8674_024357 [Pyrus ussuriensis x Pyrus communis]